MLHQKPCIEITLTDTKPSVLESKIGGFGYLPHDAQFPCDKEGNQLRLLAQIDCSQVDFEPFPKSGLLQFWILNDDVCGLNFDDATNQDTFRVIYYSEIDPTITEEEIQKKYIKSKYDDEDDYNFPVLKECGMEFHAGTSVEMPEWNCDPETQEEFENSFSGSCHQIGGYPYFTQDDPRTEDSPYDFLLFQLDTDDDETTDRVMWGDDGIGNFFINSEKLKHLDFTDVLYNWDCC